MGVLKLCVGHFSGLVIRLRLGLGLSDYPQYTTTLNIGTNDPSSDIFYNPEVQSDANLKVKDKFRSKEDCVRAIKKFHMINNYDFHVDRPNAERYRIICTHPECNFHITASYRLRSDS